MELCLEGLARAGEGPDGPGLAHLLHETASAYSEHALRERGEPYARQALAMAERLGDAEMQVHALATLSRFPGLSGEEAMALAVRAVELAEAHGLLLAGQRAHRSLAYRFNNRGDFSAVLEHFQRGVELAGQAGLTASQSGMFETLARLALEDGKFGPGEQALAWAHRLLQDLDEPTAAATLIQVPEIIYLGHKGQWAVCAQQARALRVSLRERGAERDQAYVAGQLGLVIIESRRLGTAPYAGGWQEAEAALTEATEILDRSLSPAWAIWTRVLWGSLCLCQGRLADARRLLAEACQKAEVWKEKNWAMGQREWLAAQVAAAGEEWDESMHWFEAACRILGDMGRCWWCARVRLDWAEAYASRGKPGDRQRAAEQLREARAAFEEMGVLCYAAIAEERLQAIAAASRITTE
jgi:hypothetical protein